MNNQKLTIEELRDSKVIGSNAEEIGSVGEVYLDDQSSRVTFVTVKTGLFGMNESFVPVHGAKARGKELHVPYTKDEVKDAPNMDADGHLSPDEEAKIYDYYEGLGMTGRAQKPAAAAGDARGVKADDNSVTLHEERVDVGTQRVETGRVKLRKHVVTDTKTVEVPVEREEVEVVREPIADGEVGGQLAEGEAEVTLTEERPVVEKDVVATERVGLQKDTVEETRKVSTDVSHEEIDVESTDPRK